MTQMMTQPYLMNHHKTLYVQLLKLDSSFKLSMFNLYKMVTP